MIHLVLAVFLGSVGCKRPAGSSLREGPVNGIKASGQAVPTQIATFPRPIPERDDATAPSSQRQAEVQRALEDSGAALPKDPLFLNLADGETVAFARDEFGLSAIGSVTATGQAFEWDTATTGFATKDQQFLLKDNRLAFRHGIDTDPFQDLETVPYFIYAAMGCALITR